MYQEQYRNVFESNKLANVFLITPQSSESRIRQIDEAASGFIYMVSTASTTGARSGISDSQTAYFERITAMNLRNPRQIGFGIGDAESFRTACQHAQGAIIGSALIKAISSENPTESAVNFVKSIR